MIYPILLSADIIASSDLREVSGNFVRDQVRINTIYDLVQSFKKRKRKTKRSKTGKIMVAQLVVSDFSFKFRLKSVLPGFGH